MRPSPSAPAGGASPEHDRYNYESSAAVRQLLSHPLLRGRQLELGELDAGTNRVAHGLGRKPVGWFVVRQTGQGDIWEAADVDAVYLHLASDSTTAQWAVWVY